MSRNLRMVGRGVAVGIAVGAAVVAVREAGQVRYRLAASGVDRERQRLRGARSETRRQLEEISSRVSRTMGQAQAAIFAAQLLMLDDPLFTARVEALIRNERLNADWALEKAIGELREAFAETEKPEDTNPLVLKPNFFGIVIDLPKAWKWVTKRWRKQP